MAPKADQMMSSFMSVPKASVARIAAGIFFLIVARLIVRAFYRVYFHPLSKYPGPKLSAATQIPLLVAQWQGMQHKRLVALHRKYGNVVRTAPNELSFIDPDAWRDIYGHGTKGTPGRTPPKHKDRYSDPSNKTPSLIVATDADHARMRRVFNPAFSDRALKMQELLFMKYVNLLAAKLREGIEEDADRKFDMVRMYNFTTFDIMGDLTFGEPLHMLEQAEYDPWVAAIFSSVRVGNRIAVFTTYPIIKKLFRAMIPASMIKKRAEHFQHSVDRVKKRVEKGRNSEGVDLWDFVLNQPEGKGMTRDEMDSNASLLMIAGTETTATLVAGLTYLLLKHPQAMETLTKEIRDAFEGPSDMTIEKVASLPFLNACVKEALRLYPPVVLGLPRLTPKEGSTICGHFVPPGIVVSVPQLATYTSESNFKDPLSFLPERWLGDRRFEGDKRAALQPFSVGTRDCLGKNLAYHEMRLMLARVLYSFDLELCPESDNWREQRCFVLWEKHPLMCKLKAVE